MKKGIAAILTFGLLLAAFAIPVSAVSAGEFHGGIYWNDELSVGFELMEEWEYSSEDELSRWNEGWQNAEGHCQMLMQAIYESYVGIVNLTVDQPTDDAVVEMSEEEYLKWQLPTMEDNIEMMGLELCQSVVEPIFFWEKRIFAPGLAEPIRILMTEKSVSVSTLQRLLSNGMVSSWDSPLPCFRMRNLRISPILC